MSPRQHTEAARALLASPSLESIEAALEHLKAAKRLHVTDAEQLDYLTEPQHYNKRDALAWAIGKKRAETARKRALSTSKRLLEGEKC